MISKEVQYRIYAGTRKDDLTGWTRGQVQDGNGDAEIWTLDLGNGYHLDCISKEVKGFLKTRKVRVHTLRHDRIVEDPDGEYRDVNISMLFNVKIMVSADSIKFDSGNNTFALLSREPVDWEEFSEGAPDFDSKESDENWGSFYS